MKKINLEDLQIGMYVCQLDRSWLETPFLLEGVWLRSQSDIDEIKRHCEYVYIDTEIKDGASVERSGGSAWKPNADIVVDPGIIKPDEGILLPGNGSVDQPRARFKIKFEEEFGPAKEIHNKATEVVHNMYEDVRLGRSIDTAGAKDMVKDMVGSIVRNPDAQVWLTHLKNKDDYTATHSLNVCIFSLAFGRHLGLSDEELNELGIGALLHDLGKIRVPIEILNKPEKLTAQEFALMKKHPVFGGNILENTKGLTPSIIDIALSHHERTNGSGYPRGLLAKDISLYGKMVAIVDIYDAITSQRVYHHGTHSIDAMTQLYQLASAHLDNGLVDQFIQCLGIYPIGSIVELYSGEVGIVVSQHSTQRLKPKVMVILDKDKQRYSKSSIIDLAEADGMSVNDIIRVAQADEFDIDIRNYIKDGSLG
ncbi:MAG: HD-GYP domain-containing protein [Gammaproteobacteria bacterium]